MGEIEGNHENSGHSPDYVNHVNLASQWSYNLVMIRSGFPILSMRFTRWHSIRYGLQWISHDFSVLLGAFSIFVQVTRTFEIAFERFEEQFHSCDLLGREILNLGNMKMHVKWFYVRIFKADLDMVFPQVFTCIFSCSLGHVIAGKDAGSAVHSERKRGLSKRN